MKPTALITGAGKRLGRSVALQLAEMGYALVLHYHQSEKEVLALQAELESKGAEALCLQADFLRAAERNALMEAAKAWRGTLNLLVNNAALFAPDRLSGLSESSWQRQLSVNATAPLFLIRDFSRATDSGLVINLIDSRTDWNDIRYFSYTLSKQLLKSITLMAAKALAPRIRVVGIAPGAVLAPENGQDESLIAGRPLRHIDRSRQIQRTVEYIVQNDYVNGDILYVDGGLRWSTGSGE